MTSKRYKLKVSLLGDGAVGKTSLIRRYVYDEYDDDYILTLGAKTTMKNLEMSSTESDTDVEVTMMIWDIMGQKEFKNLHKTFFKGSHGAFIVADVTRRETLTGLDQWVTDLYDVTGTIPLVFIINKWDLKDKGQFTFEEFEEAAKKYNAPAYVSSAKTGENVDAFFYKLAQEVVEKNLNEKIEDFKEEEAAPAQAQKWEDAKEDEDVKEATPASGTPSGIKAKPSAATKAAPKPTTPSPSGPLSAQFEQLVEPLLNLIGKLEEDIENLEDERKAFEAEKAEWEKSKGEAPAEEPPKKEEPPKGEEPPPPEDDAEVEEEVEEEADKPSDSAKSAVAWEDFE